MELQLIQNKIYEIRGHKVMIDFDLAHLFEVLTKNLNLAVKRNIDRFPSDFMFQLTKEEWEALRLQIETLNDILRLQNATLESGKGRHTKYLPYAFTEHGVTMLASVLKSKRAVQMNIAIVRAFIEMKKQLSQYTELAQKIHTLESTANSQFLEIYEALENLINDTEKLKTIQKNKTDFENRERIGFKTGKK
jgi:phage regulator Rha-like protein